MKVTPNLNQTQTRKTTRNVNLTSSAGSGSSVAAGAAGSAAAVSGGSASAAGSGSSASATGLNNSAGSGSAGSGLGPSPASHGSGRKPLMSASSGTSQVARPVAFDDKTNCAICIRNLPMRGNGPSGKFFFLDYTVPWGVAETLLGCLVLF